MPKIDPTYKEQLDLQKYADRRRQEIQDFITQKNAIHMTLHEAKQLLNSDPHFDDPHYEKKIYAVLDPLIVASLSYKPVRLVVTIREITLKRKQWLINYWQEKYEIDVSETSEFGDWNHQVGLLFKSWWYDYNYYEYYEDERIYDYPSCLIATFLLIQEGE